MGELTFDFQPEPEELVSRTEAEILGIDNEISIDEGDLVDEINHIYAV